MGQKKPGPKCPDSKMGQKKPGPKCPKTEPAQIANFQKEE